MQNSKEKVSKHTNPLKNQQPENLLPIVNWAIWFLDWVGRFITLKWLFGELGRLYRTVMLFLHLKIQHYPVFENPHTRAVSKTVGFLIMDKTKLIRIPIVGVQLTKSPEPFHIRALSASVG